MHFHIEHKLPTCTSIIKPGNINILFIHMVFQSCHFCLIFILTVFCITLHEINWPYYPDSITCKCEQIFYEVQSYVRLHVLVILLLTNRSNWNICFLWFKWVAVLIYKIYKNKFVFFISKKSWKTCKLAKCMVKCMISTTK